MKNDLSLHVVGAITICTYRCILRVTMQGDRKSNKYKYTRKDIRVMIRFEGKKKIKIDYPEIIEIQDGFLNSQMKDVT